jgi:hypothetical protein
METGFDSQTGYNTPQAYPGTPDDAQTEGSLGELAQLVEHRLCKAGVRSSSLLFST